MAVPLLDLKAQYTALRDEIRAAMDGVCDAQYFILGPKVEAFEKNVAAYSGAAYAVGVSSGTDALLAALMALDVGPGDGALTTPYTFFATAGSIVRLGATPVFVDIDPVTFNMDPECLRAVLKRLPARFKNLRLKALMPVHLYGQSADMTPLLTLARERGLKVIEDACQAIGAEYPLEGRGGFPGVSHQQCEHPLLGGVAEGRGGFFRTGAMGDLGCFSFFPSKNLGGFGDGGMITTGDAALAERLRQLRNHGSKPKYYHPLIGGNFRLDALQAAVLDIKLKHLDAWHQRRRDNAAVYDRLFAGTVVVPPRAVYRDSGATQFHIYNQYVVRVPGRDRVRQALTDAKIGCEIYYPVPLHLQPCFEGLGYREGDFPESEKAAKETLALPIYPELTERMIGEVAETVLRAV